MWVMLVEVKGKGAVVRGDALLVEGREKVLEWIFTDERRGVFYRSVMTSLTEKE